MIRLLSRIFIGNYQDLKNPQVRKQYGVLMSVVGILVNILLSAGKFVVGTLSGAISITADALNNLSDAGSQIISLISFKISAKPADRGHPFGHARMEYVASMIVSFLILLVGIELGKESAAKIFDPVQPRFSPIAVIVLAGSILVKLWLGFSCRQIGKRIDSSVMRATAADSFSDVLATSAVLVSALISRFTSFQVDGYMGLAVAVLILIEGFKILNETKNAILGSAPDPQVVSSILHMAGEYPDILGIHDLVVHSYGPGNTIASLHAEVDGARDVYYIHEVIDKLEKQLYRDLGVQATIHMDPTVTDDEWFSQLCRRAAQAARAVDSRISIHDCRYMPSDEPPRLLFDMDIPYELSACDARLCAMVEEKLHETDPQIQCQITVDRR